MSVATLMSVAQVAERATNHRKGGTGVLPRYVQAEIKRGNLNATRVGNQWTITEQDFQEWEAKRGRPPQENEP
jgi:hypothetical protein